MEVGVTSVILEIDIAYNTTVPVYFYDNIVVLQCYMAGCSDGIGSGQLRGKQSRRVNGGRSGLIAACNRLIGFHLLLYLLCSRLGRALWLIIGVIIAETYEYSYDKY